MTGKLSKNFHGVGIGPLSKILAVKSQLKANEENSLYDITAKKIFNVNYDWILAL